MTGKPLGIDELNEEETLRLIGDFLHRIVLHYGLWFNEVRHQMGTARAMEALDKASQRSVAIQLKRLANVLGIEMVDGGAGTVETDVRRTASRPARCRVGQLAGQ